MKRRVRKTDTTVLPFVPSLLSSSALPVMTLCFSGNDALAFDGVDFDEPMEVGLEEEKPVMKDDVEPKATAKVAVKAEPKAEPQDPVLL